MIDQSHTDLVNQSYGRCLVKGDFWDKFYDNFLASSDKIGPMFTNTDLERQKGLIKSSLNFVISYAKDPSSAFVKGKLEHVGDIHSHSKLNVAPDLYPFWEDSLVKTVRECDDQFSPELESTWRTVISPAIELLKSKY